ncbi:hypothetical protein D3C80_1544790 [compost metagenome]
MSGGKFEIPVKKYISKGVGNDGAHFHGNQFNDFIGEAAILAGGGVIKSMGSEHVQPCAEDVLVTTQVILEAVGVTTQFRSIQCIHELVKLLLYSHPLLGGVVLVVTGHLQQVCVVVLGTRMRLPWQPGR